MAEPTAQEVLMLALINRARLNPAGEAARYGIDLNEGLPSGTISTSSKQPLAFSTALNTVADAHSQAMIDNDFFAHIDPNTGSTPQSRGNTAGYSGSIGENIGWRGSTGTIDATQMASLQHQDLFVDSGVAGRGHRLNILDNRYQQVGVGQILGVFTSGGNNFNASMVTQDFGIPTGSTQFITGITFNDTDGDKFYSVGEARAGVAVATSLGTYTTGTAGAFSGAVATGTHTVTFSGGGLPSPVSVDVTVSAGVNALLNLVGTSAVETSVNLTAISGVTKIIGLGNTGLSLTGSGADDIFVTALGNDIISGAGGSDTVEFSEARSSYTITDVGGGSIRVSGPDGTNTLTSIEHLRFTDQVVDWPTQTTSTHQSFTNSAFVLAAFGGSASAGSWTSQNQYTRSAADVNGDGKADIVGFGADGVHVSLANANGGFSTSFQALSAFGAGTGGWSNDNLYHRELADVNGDGKADIVGFGYSGVYVALATGAGGFAQPVLELSAFTMGAGGWANDDTYPRRLADVNGDGKADIVGFGDAGIYVALATGNGGFTQPTLVLSEFGANAGGWRSNDVYPRELADVNGDGKADIVGFGDAGVYASLAKDGGFASAQLGLAAFGAGANAGGWASDNIYPRALADVNGDGKADIVGFGNAGVYVALSKGDGTFAQPEFKLAAFGAGGGGWSSDEVYHRELADINGDHLADIIGFGYNGVYAAWSQLL